MAQAAAAAEERRAPLSRRSLTFLLLIATLLICGFAALGTWQLQRRAWKLDLMARVEQRVHAPAVAAPARREWPLVSAARDEYRRVWVQGIFLHEQATLVQASTVLGGGFWLLTPLRRPEGSIVLINRGFVAGVPGGTPARVAAEPQGSATVTGLLRISEPNGGFLRRNDSAANRWTSRDVAGIAQARGLTAVAPYFIDAEAGGTGAPAQGGDTAPVAGLTVIGFANNHLVYAITWYTLAAMVAAGAGRLLSAERQLRRSGPTAPAEETMAVAD